MSQKPQYTWLLVITFATVDQFTKFFHWQIPEEILYTHIIKILHLTLNILLHYLVKFNNYNCCRLQWHIVCTCAIFRHALRLADAIWRITPMRCRHDLCLQWAATFPKNCHFPSGDRGPRVTHGLLGPPKSPSQTASRSVQPFLLGSWTWPTDRQTDRQTDWPHYSVCSNRPLLLDAM